MNIILGSESFLKNYIFEKAKIPYTKVPADIDESIYSEYSAADQVKMLAKAKCEKLVDGHNQNVVIITADTLITDSTGSVFTKAASVKEGYERALTFSGETINVFTGVTIFINGSYESTVSKTSITYQKFSEENLKRLMETDDPRVRNGLGIFFDAPGFTLIEKIDGSYTGAMGLPMEFVYSVLEKHNAI